MKKLNDKRKKQISKKKKDYIPEQNQKARPIEMGNFKRYLKKEDAICKLLTDAGRGTGFICQTKMKDKIMKFLFTNNHILDESKIKIGSNIKIKDKDDIKIINNRFVCTNEELDYTCIEIFDNEKFEKYFIIDHDINCDNPFEEYKDDLIVIMQYPGNKDLSIAEGKIIEFKKDNNDNTYIIHSVSTEQGSSGSPIILSNRNLNIIGIHLGAIKDYNKAVYFKNVLEDIEKQYSNFIEKNIKIKPRETNKIRTKILEKYSFKQFVKKELKW